MLTPAVIGPQALLRLLLTRLLPGLPLPGLLPGLRGEPPMEVCNGVPEQAEMEERRDDSGLLATLPLAYACATAT